MAKKKPQATAHQQEVAKLFAMVVRNAMEDFHAEHLSDALMKELNPIIRNAICTAFHMIENFDDTKVREYGMFQKMLIPDYWEEPELLDEYVMHLTMTKKDLAAEAKKINEAFKKPTS
ncbi:hypothetical protein V5E97_18850 [Singulisphaera sp. Ch08]|uniref:Uncharacterized protein n=1 Tax=Singulisphaera sp. Ch08 TaxID=3120278 RepID=A0AAU7CSK0_9BACT